MSLTKTFLRSEMREKRDGQTEAECRRKSTRITGRLLAMEEFRGAACVALYVPKGSEVGVRPAIERARRQGKEVLVPVTNDRIEWAEFTGWENMMEGKYGIPEPSERRPPRRPPDLIVVPALAFDLHGHRVGYGKGHYDRMLRDSNGFRVGVGYDFQIVEKILHDENDQRMDCLLTEKREIRIR